MVGRSGNRAGSSRGTTSRALNRGALASEAATNQPQLNRRYSNPRAEVCAMQRCCYEHNVEIAQSRWPLARCGHVSTSTSTKH